MQRTLSSACIFKSMSLCMHKQNLEYEVHTNMTNMQNYAPPTRPHFADGATVPRCFKWAWV